MRKYILPFLLVLIVVGFIQFQFYKPSLPQNYFVSSKGIIAYDSYGDGEKTLIATLSPPSLESSVFFAGRMVVIPPFAKESKKSDRKLGNSTIFETWFREANSLTKHKKRTTFDSNIHHFC